MSLKLNNLPLLYLITDRLQFSATSQIAWKTQLEAISLAAQAGCQFIQIREKDLSARELGHFVKAACSAARPYGTKIFVNDRLDVALATGAEGIHLRTNSLPVTEVRRVTSDDFLIGVSTHSRSEALAAEAGGADFIVWGPVFYTSSKSSYGEPLGVKLLAEICEHVKIPVLALGGITMDNFSACLAHHAAGIAAISLFNNFNTLGTNIKMMLSSSIEPTR